MAIFQKSIVDKYLLTLDEGLIDSAFDTYKSVYVPKIARIRNLKEEQYQTQFLQDIGNWAVDNVTQCLEFSYNTPSWTLPQPNFTNCTQ